MGRRKNCFLGQNRSSCQKQTVNSASLNSSIISTIRASVVEPFLLEPPSFPFIGEHFENIHLAKKYTYKSTLYKNTFGNHGLKAVGKHI